MRRSQAARVTLRRAIATSPSRDDPSSQTARDWHGCQRIEIHARILCAWIDAQLRYVRKIVRRKPEQRFVIFQIVYSRVLEELVIKKSLSISTGEPNPQHPPSDRSPARRRQRN